jgi:hypothetical protein
MQTNAAANPVGVMEGVAQSSVVLVGALMKAALNDPGLKDARPV